MKPDLAVVHAGQLVTFRGSQQEPTIIEDGAMTVVGGRVTWVGTSAEYGRRAVAEPRRTLNVQEKLVTPGFVDPHTHLLFAGSREDELSLKAAGESYLGILEKGGGISRTIRETRKAAGSDILSQSMDRVSQLLRKGVTTIEVKTGYGQDVKSELKLLRVLGLLARKAAAEVVPTFLGLHARPEGFARSGDYAKYVVSEMLPAVSALKDRPAFADCFCEVGVFSREECARYLRAAARLGFRLKLHADEFGDSGGASLAAETGAVSADHLGHSERSGLKKMARRGVVAVLLPGTSLLSGIQYADAAMIQAAGCKVALGTDLSPNSWVESPGLVMALACSALKMSPGRALAGFTINAAAALGRSDIGNLKPGARADFVVHDLPGFEFLPYRLGGDYVESVFRDGAEVYSASVS